MEDEPKEDYKEDCWEEVGEAEPALSTEEDSADKDIELEGGYGGSTSSIMIEGIARNGETDTKKTKL
ncbi:unnamed protein product [Linum trigynum]|uniref:Uncharacterized protein n=1 Tax=Linum trigynum TaxID=586398 RepID=A0AAV2EDA6_9ROSI